jgi:hypothetical protein
VGQFENDLRGLPPSLEWCMLAAMTKVRLWIANLCLWLAVIAQVANVVLIFVSGQQSVVVSILSIVLVWVAVVAMTPVFLAMVRKQPPKDGA